jgi:chorismate lyase/3-hydroxybenzoate synthase
MSRVLSLPSLACALVRGAAEIERELGRADCQRLLAVVYGLDGPLPAVPGSPTLSVANRVLVGEPAAEVWRSDRPVRSGRRDRFAWGEDGRLLAACRTCPVDDEVDLAAATRHQFAEALDLLAEQGYPHLLRVWNYLPGINRGDGDRERYRQFNLGRARAFEERFGAEGADWRAPASSAVGTSGRELCTLVLASRGPVIRLENPRQVPAHRYPLRYGKRAPSFSRAALVVDERGCGFFLSGTASVVGHESVHGESLAGQLAETLRNVEQVLERARLASARDLPGLGGFDLVKVYLRDRDRLDAVTGALASALGTETPVLVLEADICRTDLLVEIDGFALR